MGRQTETYKNPKHISPKITPIKRLYECLAVLFTLDGCSMNFITNPSGMDMKSRNTYRTCVLTSFAAILIFYKNLLCLQTFQLLPLLVKTPGYPTI